MYVLAYSLAAILVIDADCTTAATLPAVIPTVVKPAALASILPPEPADCKTANMPLADGPSALRPSRAGAAIPAVNTTAPVTAAQPRQPHSPVQLTV
jgi:hypothetical protein